MSETVQENLRRHARNSSHPTPGGAMLRAADELDSLQAKFDSVVKENKRLRRKNQGC